MDSTTFQAFSTLIEKESGIHLAAEKQQLLINRIQKRMRALNLGSADKYLEIIEADVSGKELMQLLDAISTNTTFFFREEKHFEILQQLLTEMRDAGLNEIKIWCAASSSGEEPYSRAMTAAEVFGPAANRVKILATDISMRVLTHAANAVYRWGQLEKVPNSLREKYFEASELEGKSTCRIRTEIRQRVAFKRLNLISQPLPLKGPIDIIFCRNVMIYFQRQLRQQLVREFSRLLRPGGYLFVSHAENLLGLEHDFENAATAVYHKPAGGR